MRASVFLALLIVQCVQRADQAPLARLTRATEGLGQTPFDVRIDPMLFGMLCSCRSGVKEPALIRLRGIAAQIVIGARQRVGDPVWQDAGGVAALVVLRSSEGVEMLRRATILAPERAEYWDHLAAAYLEANRVNGDPQALVEALASVDRALELNRELPSGRFNRAIVLERLGLSAAARHAWTLVRQAEHSQPWIREAECRMLRLHLRRYPSDVSQMLAAAAKRGDHSVIEHIVRDSPQGARAAAELVCLNNWATSHIAGQSGVAASHLAVARAVGMQLHSLSGESLLADSVRAIDVAASHAQSLLATAQRDYYKARVLYKKRRSTESEPLFRRAASEFKAAGSPLALVADFYTASCLYDRGHNEEALSEITGLLKNLPQRYRALRAHLLWEKTTALSRAGQLHEALATARESIAIFRELGEIDNATVMRGAAAGLHSLLGHQAEAWRERLDIFRRLSDSGDDEALQQALNTAARTEALLGHWETTESLLTLDLETPLRVNARLTTSSLIWRALASQRIGRSASVPADIAEARVAANTIADSTIRRGAVAELTFAEATLVLERDPRACASLMTDFITASQSSENPFLLAEAFLERARAYRSLGRESASIDDLRAALDWIALHESHEAESYGEAYFATARNAKRELIDLLDRAGSQDEAFAVLHREKTKVRPSPDNVVVALVVLPDRLLLFVSTVPGLKTFRVAVTEDAVGKAAAELSDCTQSLDHACGAAAAERLGHWLIDPIAPALTGARRLILVPDHALAAVPFPMLRGTGSAASLIEKLPIVIAEEPPANLVAVRIRSGQKLLAVGDPKTDLTVFPELSRLVSAVSETRQVATMYDRSQILTDTSATGPAFIRAMQSAEVAHVATHAIIAPGDPSRSCLVLAGSDTDSGALYVGTIAHMRLPSLRLIVLTGCRTATPATTAGVGESIALAFLRAGAHSVIGSLWDIDDSVAARVGIAVHRELLGGASADEALRRVQIAMAHSTDTRLREPRVWAGLRIYGK